MIIKINGTAQTVSGTTSLLDLIQKRELCVDKIVIEHNYNIIPKDKYSDITLNNNDNIEIVSFVGGG